MSYQNVEEFVKSTVENECILSYYRDCVGVKNPTVSISFYYDDGTYILTLHVYDHDDTKTDIEAYNTTSCGRTLEKAIENFENMVLIHYVI